MCVLLPTVNDKNRAMRVPLIRDRPPVLRLELVHRRFLVDELIQNVVAGVPTPRVGDRDGIVITCPMRKRVHVTVSFQPAILCQT